MRIQKAPTLIVAVGLALMAANSYGQNPTPPVGTPPVVTKPVDPIPPTTTPVAPQRPIVVTVPTAPDHPTAPTPAAGAASAQIPSDVKDKLDAFKAARLVFLAKQKEVVGSIHDGITDEQRQAIKANAEEFRTRMLEIKDQFRNQELQSVIDAAKAAAEAGKNRRGER